MIIHIFTSAIFWINYFPLSKTGTGLSNTKGPDNLFLVLLCNTRKFSAYIQVNITRYTKRMNPGTQSMLTKQSDK